MQPDNNTPSTPVLTSNTRDGHRQFNRECKERANLVLGHPPTEPGGKLLFSDCGMQVAKNGSLVKVRSQSAEEKRAERKARWKAARNPATARASLNGADLGEVSDVQIQPS